MRIQIYHAVFEESPVHVATLEVDDILGGVLWALEDAYIATQNVEENWVMAGGQMGRKIKPTPDIIAKGGCRSTSVGDFALVLRDAQLARYNCEVAGWRKV